MFVQDDVVLGTLSVRENLLFSAALRLPSKTSFKERRERVDKVIKELGLESCADTKVCYFRKMDRDIGMTLAEQVCKQECGQKY